MKVYSQRIPKGINYAGTLATTMYGDECVRWDQIKLKTRKNYEYRYDYPFPENNKTAASNYCRNPAGIHTSGPFCYTELKETKSYKEKICEKKNQDRKHLCN